MAKVAKDEVLATAKIRIKPELDKDALDHVIEQIESMRDVHLPNLDKSIRDIVTIDIENALELASSGQLINELRRRNKITELMVINARVQGAFEVMGPGIIFRVPFEEVGL